MEIEICLHKEHALKNPPTEQPVFEMIWAIKLLNITDQQERHNRKK